MKVTESLFNPYNDTLTDMRTPHPRISVQWEMRARPWYTHTYVRPYTPKPAWVPPSGFANPRAVQKAQARARPVYTRTYVRPYTPKPAYTPPSGFANPPFVQKAAIRARWWQNYQPWKGWPRRLLQHGVNV